MKDRTSRSEHEFCAVLDGLDVLITFTRTTTFSRDSHYGADADGRRGVVRDFADDDEPTDVRVSWDDEAGGVREAPLAALAPAARAAVTAAVDHYLNTHDPEPPDDGRERGDDDGAEYADPRDRDW